MSMVLAVVTLGDANIARILSSPPLVWRVIAPDDPSLYENAVRSASAPSLWARLMGKARPSPARQGDAEGFDLGEGEGLTVDLDKAWHGLHYLFTGTADDGSPPLDFLVAGGRSVGDIDVGYGPARVLSAAATRAVHDALSKVDEAALRARFDPADMAKREIYPDIWTSPPEEDDPLGYLIENAARLKDFVAQAVRRNHGLLLYLS